MSEQRVVLRECPFCGGDVAVIQTRESMYRVCCAACGVTTGKSVTKEGAEFKWNMRGGVLPEKGK